MSWDKIKVNEFCYVTDFVANGSFASLKENVTYKHKEDYARLIRITDGTKKWEGEFIWVSKSSFDFLKKSEIFPGDLIMANVGEPGKTFIIPDLGSPMTLGPNSILIRPNDKIADAKFLYYYFNSVNGKAAINTITSATTQSKFNKGSFRNLEIPLPPLETQKRIADILDAAHALRQKDQELLKKYDELAQAIFIDMFGDPIKNEKGWIIKPLGKVCKLQGGFSFKSADFVVKGIKLVKIANVNFQKLDWEEVDYLPESFINNHSDFALAVGDILMALTRPIIKSLGSVKAVKVQESDLPALLNQRVARFFPDTEIITKEFLLRIIYSDYFKNKIEKYSSTSLQPNVSNKQVESIDVFLPPKALQNNFENQAALIEVQKANTQKSLDKSEALFKNLLQKAFKGELI
jgi:type I restriction enzyme, S subunit